MRWALALGVLAVAGLVFAGFAAHAPRHGRFGLEDRWASVQGREWLGGHLL